MTVSVHLPEMIHKDLLSEHPRNSNKQSRYTFKELRKSIRENGFDESLTVVPRDDGNDGYWIVSGNHRYRAGIAEGMEEFPCVVRTDWDDIQQQVELVRRNYVRGNIDKNAFTVAVNALVEERGLEVDELRDMMGFEDADVFMKYYQEQEEEQQRIAAEVRDDQKRSAPAVKMIDDLGLVLSAIFEEHGDTVPHSFIVFPAGGKKHFFVAATPAIVRNIQDIAEYCIANHQDINIVLGGILAIGKHHSHLGKDTVKTEQILEEGSSEDGDSEFS